MLLSDDPRTPAWITEFVDGLLFTERAFVVLRHCSLLRVRRGASACDRAQRWPD